MHAVAAVKIHLELVRPAGKVAIGQGLPTEAARDIGEPVDLAEARHHRFERLRDRREIREINAAEHQQPVLRGELARLFPAGESHQSSRRERGFRNCIAKHTGAAGDDQNLVPHPVPSCDSL